MTPAELLHSLSNCPMLETSLAVAAAELEELRVDARLPRNLAVTIIFHCAPSTLAESIVVGDDNALPVRVERGQALRVRGISG
jgi:hypothetical protein